jgi:hypothetical protein
MGLVQQGEVRDLGKGAGEREGNQKDRGEGIVRESVGAGGASRRPELELGGKREVCSEYIRNILRVEGRGISFYLSPHVTLENPQQGQWFVLPASLFLSIRVILRIDVTQPVTEWRTPLKWRTLQLTNLCT